ncbi:MAG: hypothetical protein QG620_851 [Patescibacteria group bacterium]|nr:hypothetical protein [Patescibacteria group bacterium]
MEIIKRLEDLVSFQKDCLSAGYWEEYDKAENERKRLEEELVYE